MSLSAEVAARNALAAKYGALLQRVLDRFPDFSVDEIAAMIADGRCQLWQADDGYSIAVTQIYTKGEKRVCWIWFCAGSMRPLVRLHPQILAWARGRGCTHSRITGRMGWMRVFPGYRQTDAENAEMEL